MRPGPEMPNARPPSPATFRLWMVAGFMVLIAGFAATTQIDSLQAEDTGTGDKPSSTTTTTEAGSTSTTDDADGISTTTSASTSGDEPLAPLPGDDWGPESREAFVGICETEPSLVGAAMVLTSMSADEICGCIYDRIEASDVSLDEFNEVWTSADVEAMPVDHPGKVAMNVAVTDCVAQAAG